MEEIKRKDLLQRYDRDPSDNLENHYDKICGFAYMLLITGKANNALRSWANIKDRHSLAVKLTTKLSVPVRHPENYTDKATFCIGSMYFEYPCETLIALTYGSQTKFYNKIILAKARFVVKEWKWRKETIDRTKEVTKFIRNEPTLQELTAFKQFKKGLVNSTFTLAARKNTARDKSVASQKGKDKTIIARATININGMTRKEIELNNDSSLITAVKNKISPTATHRTDINNPYNKKIAASQRKQQQHQNRTDTDSSDSNTATEQRNKRKHSTATYGNNSRH